MNANTQFKPLLKLKGLRAQHMMTQADIADKLGISKATYNRKENGIGQFDANEITCILKMFNVNYEQIFIS